MNKQAQYSLLRHYLMQKIAAGLGGKMPPPIPMPVMPGPKTPPVPMPVMPGPMPVMPRRKLPPFPSKRVM